MFVFAMDYLFLSTVQEEIVEYQVVHYNILIASIDIQMCLTPHQRFMFLQGFIDKIHYLEVLAHPTM